MKRKKSEKAFGIFNCIFLGITAFSMLYPFIYTLSISFSTTAEAMRAGFHLYPKEVSLMAYKMVLTNPNIYTGYMNTVLRTITGTVLTVIVSSMMAYSLSKKYMPNVKLFTALLLFTMIFDGGTVPNYILMNNLNLINNRFAYILPTLVGAYNIIIIKSFFQSIPECMAESAKLDGANEFRTLFSIILPISKPVLATIAMWAAVAHWNAWFDAMLYITDNSKQVLQIFLQRIIKESQTELMSSDWMNADIRKYTSETVKSATIVVTILPILLVYPFIQKYFVKGIMLGAVKG